MFELDMVMFAWNRCEYTNMTLESLIEIDSGFDWDKVNFVVVNHSSSDDTVAVVENFMNKNNGVINRFVTEPNRGVAGGFEHFRNNYCSSAPYIGKIDNDSLFTYNWLKLLFDAINSCDKIGVVGAQEFYEQGDRNNNMGKYFKSDFVGGRFIAKKEVFENNEKLDGSGIRGWTVYQRKVLNFKWDIGWCNPPSIIEHVGDHKLKHPKAIKSEEYIEYMKRLGRL